MQEKKTKTLSIKKIPIECKSSARAGNQSNKKTWQHLMLILFLAINIIAHGICTHLQTNLQEKQKRGESDEYQVRANFRMANANNICCMLNQTELSVPSCCEHKNRVLQRSTYSQQQNANLQDGKQCRKKQMGKRQCGKQPSESLGVSRHARCKQTEHYWEHGKCIRELITLKMHENMHTNLHRDPAKRRNEFLQFQPRIQELQPKSRASTRSRVNQAKTMLKTQSFGTRMKCASQKSELMTYSWLPQSAFGTYRTFL